ncbi:MAG: paraquat-inducible protein A [Alphaproteobacteria bacterium]|nr:paraquat-inducible protein A [Alphaproteobacteria bacterium]
MASGAKPGIIRGMTDAASAMPATPAPSLRQGLRGPAYAAMWLLLCLSMGLILAGIVLPSLYVEQYWMLSGEIAIIDGIGSFFARGETFLGGVLVMVTIVFPLLKVATGVILLHVAPPVPRAMGALLGVLLWLSKWSLTDVFIFAFIILVLNQQLVSEAQLREGAYVFALGIALSTLAVFLLRMIVRRGAENH